MEDLDRETGSGGLPHWNVTPILPWMELIQTKVMIDS